jgi:hypothetical protein
MSKVIRSARDGNWFAVWGLWGAGSRTWAGIPAYRGKVSEEWELLPGGREGGRYRGGIPGQWEFVPGEREDGRTRSEIPEEWEFLPGWRERRRYRGGIPGQWEFVPGEREDGRTRGEIPEEWEFLPGWRERRRYRGGIPGQWEFVPGERELRALAMGIPEIGNLFPVGGKGADGRPFPLSCPGQLMPRPIRRPAVRPCCRSSPAHRARARRRRISPTTPKQAVSGLLGRR